MKEEGGQGNRIITKMFLSLYIITHKYCDTQSHLLHTLSLPLNPHTPHTANTLTQSKSGRYELIRFLEVEERGF